MIRDMENQEIRKGHKIHRNVLYGLVAVLIISQILTFVFLSSQVAKVSSQLASTEKELSETIESYNALYQKTFKDLTSTLSEQQKSFDQQITLLKSQSGDFSAVIENAVKGVVSVGTEDSTASGFIISLDGYVVTNYHVVEGAKTIQILTYDNQVKPVTLIGYDSKRDIALLKASGTFDSLSLADSDSLQVGQKVIAIGNPLGLSFSVAEGIISAVHREGPNGLEEYIQTDTSLNPGNSGGPLINKNGEVIGITNFKVGGTEGLGFALESNPMSNVINQIAKETIA